MNKDIKICFMGTPRFGEIVLEKLIENFNVTLVVTQPDSYTKGGKVKIESPVKILAEKNGIELFQPVNIKDEKEYLLNRDFDFIITAAFGQFIPKSILELPKIKTLNVHGSILPKRRGGAPIQRAIIEGDEYLGVSIMETVSKMDAGDVYLIDKIKLEDSDNLGTMIEKLANLGSDMIVDVIEKLYNDINSIIPVKQNEDEVTISPNLMKKEELIDFNKSAKDVFNLIRGLNPNPVSKFVYNNENYKIYESIIVKDESEVEAGTIIDNKKHLVIKCGKDAIEVLKLKPEGKALMDALSFLNGSRTKFLIGNIIK